MICKCDGLGIRLVCNCNGLIVSYVLDILHGYLVIAKLPFVEVMFCNNYIDYLSSLIVWFNVWNYFNFVSF